MTEFVGRDGKDVFFGGADMDDAVGESGRDSLYGRGNDDRLVGGSGVDFLFGGGNADRLFGGFAGNADRLYGGGGRDLGGFSAASSSDALVFSLAGGGATSVATLAGLSGVVLVGIEEVSIVGSILDDTISGNVGNDTISDYTGEDSIFGGSGDDLLRAGQILGGALLDGGSGTDSVALSGFGGTGDIVFDLATAGPSVVTQGGESGHTLVSIESVSFYSGASNDTLGGGDADDFLIGGAGDDRIYGAEGDDRLFGAIGSDRLYGGSGDDFLDPVQNSAAVFGGSGTDTLAFRGTIEGDTLIHLGDGGGRFMNIVYTGIEAAIVRIDTDANLTVVGGVARDDVKLGAGNDTVFGDNGDDGVFGFSGNDILFGGSGDDLLNAGQGNNSISGGSGDDFIFVGSGASTIAGGPGVDTLGFKANLDEDTFFEAKAGPSGTVLNKVYSGIDAFSAQLSGDGSITMRGGNGGDRVIAFTGNDTLVGLSGDDRLAAMGGVNTLFGGSGFDSARLRLTTGVGKVVFDQSAFDGAVTFADGNRLAGIERVTLHTSRGDDTLTGDGQSDTFNGGAGDDLIRGRGGDDRLDTQILGTIFGGAGDDNLTSDYGRQGIYDAAESDVSLFGGEGDDDLLHRDTEQAIRQRHSRLEGKSGDDSIGVWVQNLVNGTFDGGTGNDYISLEIEDIRGSLAEALAYGGLGDDTINGEYFQAESIFSAKLFGGLGDDTVYAHQQSNEFGPADDVTLFGDAGSDTLGSGYMSGDTFDSSYDIGLSFLGGAGADTIFGEAGNGNDYMRASSGRDTLYGGSGEDFFVMGVGELRAGEVIFGGSGSDTLFIVGGNSAAALLELSNVNLIRDMIASVGDDHLFGHAAIDDFRGQDGVDRLYGLSGNDSLRGQTGNDWLHDESGDARVFGGDGDDRAFGGDGRDRLAGGSGSDLLFGDSGQDRLYGGSGVDTVAGGLGNDTLRVDTSSDRIIEFADGGVDLVLAESDYSLSDGAMLAHVEQLRLEVDFGDIKATGNSLDNTLEGNSGANRLAGNQGADHLLGGRGEDTLFGGNGGDLMEGQGGVDTLHMGAGDTVFGGGSGDYFRFNGSGLSASGSGGPLIGDFDGVRLGKANGADSLFFATGLEVGNFAYVAGRAFSGGGNSEARFAGDRQVEVDRDGDGSADIFFRVDGLSVAGGLTSTDFLWA